jgi:hypothetical protein
MELEKQVSDTWAEYKRRSALFAFVFILFIPWMLAADFFISRSHEWHLDPDKVMMGALIAFAAVFAWVSWRVVLWPCPRCGKPYHLKWYFLKTFSMACVHCGLKKWADPA